LMNAGAWAELAAVKTERLAELPESVSFEQAAALPVAGLTALLALEVAGFVLGKRVLVTGASGGVGRFAIQLAKLAGGHVTGVALRTEGLTELGADAVTTEIDVRGPIYDAILDAVGGPVLGEALQRVAPGGTVVSFASTVPDPVSYPSREFFARAPRARLYGFYLFDIIDHTRSGATDLRRLADLVAQKRLDPQIHLTMSWNDAGQAIEALLDRRVNGKAVLTVD
ncbi:MAG: zinc-binding dehydrogenase, partial [Solirubrobacteraceae bacterium]